MKRVTARLATIPSYRLARRVALITGAGRGIGREIALAYAAEGADLVLVARSANELDLVVGQATELGIRAIAVPASLTGASSPDTPTALASFVPDGVRGLAFARQSPRLSANCWL